MFLDEFIAPDGDAAPYVGAGIEIRALWAIIATLHVAPLVGAGIEIFH